MKKIVLVILFLFLLNFVSAIEVNQIEPNPLDPQSSTTLSSIQQDVKLIQIAVNKLPSKEDVDSSFQQLDSKLTSSNESSSFSSLAYVIATILLNDILIVGLYLIGKTKGVIP